MTTEPIVTPVVPGAEVKPWGSPIRKWVRVQRSKAERRANRLAGVAARKAARAEALCR